ncbi:MAG: hypothetical protein U0802_24230 [Candidatus Binatia bacterium]
MHFRSGRLPALALAMALLAAPALADEPLFARLRHGLATRLADRCITPAVDGVFQQLVEDGAFARAIGAGFTLADGNTRDERIQLAIEDVAGRRYTVALAPRPRPGQHADGEAGAFTLYVDRSAGDPPPAAATALLAAATALGKAIPDSAFAPCAAGDAGTGSRSAALANALAQIGVVLAALVFGVRRLGAGRW